MKFSVKHAIGKIVSHINDRQNVLLIPCLYDTINGSCKANRKPQDEIVVFYLCVI